MPAILAANWIETLLPLIFVFIWIARAFMEAKGSAGKENADEDLVNLEPVDEGRRDGEFIQGRADSGDRQARQQRQAKASGEDPFRSEVEEFLRRLSGEEAHQANPEQQAQAERAREKQKHAQRLAAKQAEQRRREAHERRERQRREKARAKFEQAQSEPTQSQQGRYAPAQREPTPYDAARERSARVGDPLRSHLGHLEESQLAENAAQLGEQLSQTDERVAERLHRKFDHKLGKLEHREDRPDESANVVLPSTAESLAAMLANPEGLRNAILVNEILNRPADRW